MRAIVAVDEKWGIGKEGKLLTHIPGDLHFFKEKTLGKIVIMGRETLESLPGAKPLPGRRNIVLTRNKEYQVDCEVCYSKEELFNKLKGEDPENIYIIGGELVYHQFLPYYHQIYVTKMEGDFQAEKFFDNLDENDSFEMVWESDPHEENGVRYKFTEYVKRRLD